ncbi:hypothetical protein OAE61_00550 [Verrucomicrobiales bacterium]|nr:hypothetical protein [Verrucomicrobiales bacterium]
MKCPNCESEMEQVVAELNRKPWNFLFFELGSSVLQIFSFKEKKWVDYLRPSMGARSYHCTNCDALLLPTTIED